MQTIDTIKALGFTGFIPVKILQTSKCAEVPKQIGVYMLIRHTSQSPIFLSESIGGWYKGENPTTNIEKLRENWVPNAIVVYIGKAGDLDRKATLRSRLQPYMRFGLGKPAAHRGGKYVWQLEDSANLLVCWKPTPNEEPTTIETILIREFKTRYGKIPFANRNEGRKLKD